MAKRLFLIDGTALAYRSFFAFQGGRTTLTTSKGHPTAATYGFIMTLRAILEREKPDAIAVSFDGPRGDAKRAALYPEYKSTRNKMPDEMSLQLDDIREVTKGFGIAIVESATDEADDVIGTLAVKARDAGMEVFVVTGDKDFLQLVGDKIKLWNLRSSATKPEILDAAAAEAKWGVPPGKMVDLLALMGDSSDNVPGVPKIGEKTAVELITQFGSLDALLARTAEVKKASIRQTLEDHREDALLSRELVTLHLDVPLDVDVEAIGPATPDPEALRPLFQRLEFQNLLAQLASLPKPQADVAQEYRVIRTEPELRELLAALANEPKVAVAVETSGGHPRAAKLVGIAFAWAPGKAAYVPLNLQPPLLPGGRDAILEELAPLLGERGPARTAHDGKRQLMAFRGTGVAAGPFTFDTLLASYVAHPGVQSHELGSLALRHFSFKKTAPKDLLGAGKKQKTFDQIDAGLAGCYVCEDADLALRLEPVLRQEVQAYEVEPILRDLEMPLVPVLLDMEWEGIAIDTEHLRRIGSEMQRRIEELETRVYGRAGKVFVLGSPQQLGTVLFDDLEVHRAADLPKPKRTPTGQYKTDHDVLEKMAKHHEVPQLVLEWRLLTKLKGTYVDSLPQLVVASTGRVHTTFNQAIAATGRLSSEDPNLQNIPIRTAEGQKVRAAFVARDTDWVLLSADYSQIELRILAHLSGDKALVESFRKNEDIHARTAALAHGLLPAMVTPELRERAKVINYGLMYGMGPARLANETGMTPPEAKKFIDAYFRALPGVKAYLDGSLQMAREKREVRTLFGRRRPLPDIDSTNAMLRNAAENMAVNTPIQGAAADIVKRAMLRVHAALQKRKLRAKLLLQVHDELVFDVPKEELSEVEAVVTDAMAGAAELSVPLDVAIGHGRSWLEAH